jgi:predicted aconitase
VRGSAIDTVQHHSSGEPDGDAVVTQLALDDRDRRLLDGAEGRASQIAMEIVVEMAGTLDAPRLIDVESAHIDGCLAIGQVSLDFPALLVANGGRATVPTTLNVSSLDLLHPDISERDAETRSLARRLMDAYEALGCRPTWTCAPYQLPERPSFGAQIAWAESNAIVFANSVLGARTNRYGDFFDICAALTGRVPYVGLHVTEERRARAVFRLRDLSSRLLSSDVLYPVLGYLVGDLTGTLIPAVVGLPADVSEDQFKAFGAAAASSGAVAMFHAVGVTPEAPTLDAALGGQVAALEVDVTLADLITAREALSTRERGALSAVAVGTPHFSLTEFVELRRLLRGRPVNDAVRFYASTGRGTHAELADRGWLAELEVLGVRIVTDTCTYVRPFFDFGAGTVMTDSAKWAYYAPMTVGVNVTFGSLAECVESAVAGEIQRDDELWQPA